MNSRARVAKAMFMVRDAQITQVRLHVEYSILLWKTLAKCNASNEESPELKSVKKTYDIRALEKFILE